MRVLLILFALAAGLGVTQPSFAAKLETELASPAPTPDAPRRIVLQLSSDDERHINDVLYNAINLQKFYGIDNVEIAIVAFGPGMKALYTADSPVRERVQSLLKYGISFIGCGNTLEATHRKPEELIEGVDVVQAGIAEIVERRLQGWVYISP